VIASARSDDGDVGLPRLSDPSYEVVWPLGRVVSEIERLPPRLGDLSGVVVAELWNRLYEGDRAFPLIREELDARYPGIRFVGWEVFGDFMQGAPVTDRLGDLLREHGVQATIAGVGHCGSCTPATVTAALKSEAAGIPSVSLVGSLFEPLANAVASLEGVEGLPLAVYPGRIPVDDEAEFAHKVRTTIVDQIVAGLTGAAPEVHGTAGTASERDPDPEDVVYRGTLDEVDDHFYAAGWTDGLPIVPPTLGRVRAMLAGTARDPDEVLGVLPPQRREATVWNVAVNGVMAGCRPEHMPVLIAVVEAIADRDFRIETAGAGTGWEPLIIVSGPIARSLGFNAGGGVQRVGRRANTSVGRFLRLIMRNLAGLRIAARDGDDGAPDRAGLGNSFHVVMAEDEEVVAELGWPTFGEDRGVVPGASAVTVRSVVAESPPFGEYGCSPDDPASYLEPLVEVFGKAMSGYWLFVALAFGRSHPLVVISPHVARVLHANGWTKDDVRRHLYENAWIAAEPVQRRGDYMNLDIAELGAAGRIPETYVASADPKRLIPAFMRPEWIDIVVAGSRDFYYQRGYLNYSSHGAPVTKAVDAPD
jgi:hypothetical protein